MGICKPVAPWPLYNVLFGFKMSKLWRWGGAKMHTCGVTNFLKGGGVGDRECIYMLFPHGQVFSPVDNGLPTARFCKIKGIPHDVDTIPFARGEFCMSKS